MSDTIEASDVSKFHQLLDDIREEVYYIKDIARALSVIGLPAGQELRYSAERINEKQSELNNWLGNDISRQLQVTHQHSANILMSCLAMATAMDEERKNEELT